MYLKKILMLLIICIIGININTLLLVTKEQPTSQFTYASYLLSNVSFINEEFSPPKNKYSQINIQKKPNKDKPYPHRIDPFKKEQGKELVRASSQLGLGSILLTSGIC